MKKLLEKICLINKLFCFKKNTRLALEHMEVHLVDYCNLNCKGCSHYCNLAPKTLLDIRKYKKDLKELSGKFIIQRFFIMGGEPLLHPKIEDFIKITRNYLPEADIWILSNGLLFNKMPDSFLLTCKNNNIKFSFSKYPISNIDWNKITEKINTHLGCGNYVINNTDSFYAFHNPKGDSDAQKAFNNCKERFGWCYNLRGSKVYTCQKSCYIDYYNKYFKENVPQPAGINIFEHSAKKIKDYLEKPNETCRFCGYMSECEKYPWEQTKKDKNEWNCINKVEN